MKLWTRDEGTIFIDNNMLQMGRDCLTKAYFRLTEGLILSEHTPATYFGTQWHKVMKALWGSWVDGKLEEPWDFKRAFIVVEEYDKSMEDEVKGKTKARLMKGLEEYFTHKDEALGSYKDFALENPTILAEEFVSYPLTHFGPSSIEYCGIIDRVVRSDKTGAISIIDYKTTSWNQIMDNVWVLSPQFIGYVWLVSKKLNLCTNTFILDLFQMQSKKTNKFLRRKIEIPQWMLDEWELRRGTEVINLLNSEEPFISSPKCSDYGGCPYFSLCSQSPKVRRNIMAVMYERDIWDIHGNVPVDAEGFENYLEERK